MAGDYALSANTVLTIAAGQTASTGTVTVAGVDNDVDAADKTVTVTGTAGNTVGITGPADVTLTLEDDDTRGVTVSKTELDIAEGDDGTYTVVLDSEPTQRGRDTVAKQWRRGRDGFRGADVHDRELGHGADGDGEVRPRTRTPSTTRR